MQKNCPGDVNPQEEEEQGTQSSVDTAIRVIVECVEEKGTFSQIPDKGRNEGADEGRGRFDLLLGRELVSDIKQPPDDQKRKKNGEVKQGVGRGGFDQRTDPERTGSEQGNQQNQNSISPQCLGQGAGRCFKNIVDNVIVIPKKHDRSKEHISDSHQSHFPGVVYKRVNMVHDDFGIGREEILRHEIVDLGIDVVKNGEIG